MGSLNSERWEGKHKNKYVLRIRQINGQSEMAKKINKHGKLVLSL